MSDNLTVGGGGSIAVATTGLFSHAQRLEQAQREFDECVRFLGTIDRIVDFSLLTAADAPLSAARSERAMDDATTNLHAAAVRSGMLAAALRLSADVYGGSESMIKRLSQAVAAELGVGLGFLSSTVGLLLLPSAIATVAGGVNCFALLNAVAPSAAKRVADDIRNWLEGNKAVLSDPRFVELVRLSVMSADDFGAGFLRVPPPLAHLLGDEGLGILGLNSSAATVVAAGGAAGVLRETPVVTSRLSSTTAVPAAGYADRAARVPGGQSEVRVDRYVREGEPDRFELYLGGTVDFSLTSANEPWDMTSNVVAMAGGDAGSYRAAQEALAMAGVDQNSEVVITGYSQGGLIASMLAASGDYDVRGLYTLGAPAGQVPVPSTIPWVAIEHTDDLVPAVGGTWASADPLVVRREAFTDRPLDDSLAFPAHQLSYYRETAALVDSADEQRLVEANARFDSFGRGADRVESTWFASSRVREGMR